MSSRRRPIPPPSDRKKKYIERLKSAYDDMVHKRFDPRNEVNWKALKKESPEDYETWWPMKADLKHKEFLCGRVRAAIASPSLHSTGTTLSHLTSTHITHLVSQCLTLPPSLHLICQQWQTQP